MTQRIVYTIEVKFIDKEGKEVKITTYASSASDLLNKLKPVFQAKSKTFIGKVLNIF